MDTQTITPSQRQRWIARTINTIAASQGLTQQRDLAQAVGWTESKLSRKLHQESRFSLEDVDYVAARLGVETGDLLDGWGGRVPVPDDVVPVRRVAADRAERPITLQYGAACHTTALRAVA